MAKSAAAALHTEPKEPNFLQKFGHDFVHGDIFTKLSFFVWGLGYIGHGQLMKRFWSHLYRALRCISWHSLAYPTWQSSAPLAP